MSRWVRIQTDVFEHAVFAREPFTEREAWLWLISQATWKDTKHRVGNVVLDVPVGSMFRTLRELQSVWRWKSDYRVRTFLNLLVDEGMIVLKTNAGKTQISICNYSHYQDAQRTANANPTHGQRTANALKTPIHQDTKEEANASSVHDEKFAEFWLAYPRRDGPNPRKPARTSFLRLIAKGADADAIIAAARSLAAEHPTPTRFVPQAVTWLNQERFDEAAPLLTGDEFCAADWPNTRFLLARYRQEHNHDPPSAIQSGKAGYLLPAEWVAISKQQRASNA